MLICGRFFVARRRASVARGRGAQFVRRATGETPRRRADDPVTVRRDNCTLMHGILSPPPADVRHHPVAWQCRGAQGRKTVKGPKVTRYDTIRDALF